MIGRMPFRSKRKTRERCGGRGIGGRGHGLRCRGGDAITLHMRKEGRRQYRRGRWRVQRERCRIEDWRPPPDGPEASAIAPIVKRVMADSVPPTLGWMTELHEQWASIVGETVAAHTRPGQLSGQRLYVYVDSAVWLNELKRFGRDRILLRIQAAFGRERVAGLQLVPDPGGPR